MKEDNMATNIQETMHQSIVNELSKTIEIFDISPSEARLFSILYMEDSPMTLDEMSKVLGKSKTSVSTGIRTLLDLNLVESVWKKGVRKDLYTTSNELYRKFMQTYLNKWTNHLHNQRNALTKIEASLKQTQHSTDVLDKLDKIISFHDQVKNAFSKINPKNT